MRSAIPRDEPCVLIYLADWMELLDAARDVSRVSTARLRHALEDDIGGVDSPFAQGGEGCPAAEDPA